MDITFVAGDCGHCETVSHGTNDVVPAPWLRWPEESGDVEMQQRLEKPSDDDAIGYGI